MSEKTKTVGGRTKFVKVQANQLNIHPTAQRFMLPSRVKRMAEELDLDAIGVIHAVEYEIEGKHGLWVIDGQHRLAALREHGLGEWIVEVKVHLDATDAARASALFLKLNYRAPVQPYDRFINEVRSGDAVAVGIVSVTGKCGLTVNRSAGDNKLNCVAALRRIYTVDGGKSLLSTLVICASAWGTGASVLEGTVIEGVGTVVSKYNGVMEKGALIKRLAKYSGGAPGLIASGKGMRDYRKCTLTRCIAERVIETYNTGRKTGRLDLL